MTPKEFTAAVKEHPPAMPPFGVPGGMPMPGMGSGMPMPGMPGGRMPLFGPGGPAVGWMPPGPSGFSQLGPLGKDPDLKALFAKMDKNKDGKLTVEEFTEGRKKLHEEVMRTCKQRARCRARNTDASRSDAWMPMPPPPLPMQGVMMPHSGPGPWMMGGPMLGPHGCPSLAMALDARLSELEAKLKALEAKVEAKK